MARPRGSPAPEPTRKAKVRPQPPAAPPATANKRGFLSNDDKAFLRGHADRKTAEQMGMEIRRPVGQVREFLQAEGIPEFDLKAGPNLAAELEQRPEWAEFRQQYDDEELKFFKYRYVLLMNQFGRDDVLPTEEIQIFNLIQYEIMANHAMRERKTLVTQQKAIGLLIEAAEKEIAAMPPGSGDAKRLKAESRELYQEYAGLSDKLKSITQRQDSYQMRMNSTLENLKGTRDQRIKVFQDSGKSFLGYLKALTQEDFRDQQGREMELMRAAMGKEQGRLARPHEYVDGTKDQPLLTPETVLAEDGETT